MKKLLSLAVSALLLGVLACGNDSNPAKRDEPAGYDSPERYIVNPAWVEEGENTIEVPEAVMSLARTAMRSADVTRHLQVVFAGTDGEYNYYTILMGHIDNTPVVSGAPVRYNGSGTTSITISRVTGELNETSFTNSITRAITETVFASATSERSYGVSGGFSALGISLGADRRVKNTITNSLTSERSLIDTWETANSQTTMSMDVVSAEIGNANEPAGRYRWTLFATTDVYLTVVMSRDNETVEEQVFTVSARENSYTWDIDFDPNLTGSFEDEFPRTNIDGFFPFPEDFGALLPPPEDVPEILPPITVYRFVAVGNSGNIVYSDDGIAWNEATVDAFDIQWNNVTFANNMFVAVGNTSEMAFSRDGISWYARQNIPTGIRATDVNWNGIAFGDNVWVAVGTSNHTSTSSGGTINSTWRWGNSVRPDIGGTGRPFTDVIFAKDRFVAVASNDRIAQRTSSEATWRVTNIGDSRYLNAIIFGDDLFVVVANDGYMRTSFDGVTWPNNANHRYRVGSNNWNGLGYGAGKFVAVGARVNGQGQMAYSSTAANSGSWTQINVGTTDWKGVVYGDLGDTGRWVAVGAASGGVGRMVYSDDGISWSQEERIGTGEWQAVTFGSWEEEQ